MNERLETLRDLRAEMTRLVIDVMLETPGMTMHTVTELESLKVKIGLWDDGAAHRVAYVLRSSWVDGSEGGQAREVWGTLAGVVLAASSTWLMNTAGPHDPKESTELAESLWNLACLLRRRGKNTVAIEVLASSRCPRDVERVMELCHAAVAASS